MFHENVPQGRFVVEHVEHFLGHARVHAPLTTAHHSVMIVVHTMIVGKRDGGRSPLGELVFDIKDDCCECRHDHDNSHACVDTVLEKAPIIVAIVSYVYG